MADVAINKRTVLVTNPASQQDFPGSTAPPVITPDVEVNFLELIDTPESYENEAGKVSVVKSDEDGLEFQTSKQFIFDPLGTKATPISADRLVISDSEDSDELKVISISDLPVEGSKWTEVASGIYRESSVGINVTTLSVNEALVVKSGVTSVGILKTFRVLDFDDNEMFVVNTSSNSGNRSISIAAKINSSGQIFAQSNSNAGLGVIAARTNNLNGAIFTGFSNTGASVFMIRTDGVIRDVSGIVASGQRSSFTASSTAGYGIGVVDIKNTINSPTVSIFRVLRHDNAVNFLVAQNHVFMPNLATSDPLVFGALWDDNGVIKRSAG